jgi:hypothetical protein
MSYLKLVWVIMLCCSPLMISSPHAQEEEIKGKRIELDIEAEKYRSSIIGCLRPALKVAGTDWSKDYLSGYLGSAFAFSMKEDGGKLNQADNHEWSYFWRMISPLNKRQISASKKKDDPDWKEKHIAAKKEAWNKIRSDIDKGYPTIVWQPMTAETKASGKRPIPFLWGLIIGYDQDAETYIVHHSGSGKFEIRWDAFGHSDGANWFCVMTFKPIEEPFDIVNANRKALTHAIESSQGKRPGVRAPAHGLSAWEMWLKAFKNGTVQTGMVNRHATFLIKARGAAAVYLREIQSHFPERTRTHLQEAANAYDRVVSEIEELRAICAPDNPDLQKGSQTLAKALEAERFAITNLKSALESE